MATGQRLGVEPPGFFMTLRDIAFWIRSARTDSLFAQARAKLGAGAAFDHLYEARPDPFGSTLPQYRYQRHKYETVISMLPRRRYAKVLDIGCGLGPLTRALAPHCGHVLGLDISAEAVRQARDLSAHLPHVEFRAQDATDLEALGRIEARYDLIVLADILYYISPLEPAFLDRLIDAVARLLAPDGIVLVVNHSFFAFDAASRLTRSIHRAFSRSPGLAQQAEYVRAFYLTTLLVQRPVPFPIGVVALPI